MNRYVTTIMGIVGLNFWVLPLEAATLKVVPLGKLTVNKPAFVQLDTPSVGAPYRLIINSFNMFGGDEVRLIDNVGSTVNNFAAASAESMITGVTWPNETKRVPAEVFGANYFTVAQGFLVPGKSNGAVSLFDESSGKIVKVLSTPKSGYFYHHVVWADMNNDGKLDLITARATKSLFGSGSGEIVWLEQPNSPLNDEWQEHLIASGPDVNFIYQDIDGDGTKKLVATEFFGQKLSLFWQEGGSWQQRTIDESIGAGFDLQLVDLNNDGRKDLLVTNHVQNGSVFAYEIPQDSKTGKWTRHTLLSNIKTTSQGFGQAAPGGAVAFYPHSNDTTGKPSIVVAGDGSQRAYVLSPVSNNSDNWQYTAQIILQVKKGVIGQIAVGDVDGDNNAELFVPAYDENAIYLFRTE